MTGLIILAAGESSRLGQPKQNLVFQGKTLLQWAIESALGSTCKPIVVVLGANADLIDRNIRNKEVNIIYNPDWNEGMASSIRIAIKEIEKTQAINSVIIMLCDQPFVSPALINDMIAKQQETNKPIVACAYKNTIGVPVLFSKSLFTQLRLLKGWEGAKKILSNHAEDIATISFEMGSIDIDTPDDYEQLRKLSD